MGHGIRTARKFRTDHGIKRHHRGTFRTPGPHINFRDIIRTRPELRQRFGLHPVHPTEFNEIVDVEIAKIGLQGIEHFRNRDTQSFGPFPIHPGIESRRRHAKTCADRSNGRILLRPAHKLLRHRGKLFEISTARIL